MGTKKEENIDKMTRHLKEWSSWIEEMESRAEGTAAGMKAGYETRIRELKKKRDALSLKLREFGPASGDAWSTLRTGIGVARKDLKEAVSAVRDKFKKAA